MTRKINSAHRPQSISQMRTRSWASLFKCQFTCSTANTSNRRPSLLINNSVTSSVSHSFAVLAAAQADMKKGSQVCFRVSSRTQASHSSPVISLRSRKHTGRDGRDQAMPSVTRVDASVPDSHIPYLIKTLHVTCQGSSTHRVPYFPLVWDKMFTCTQF